MFFLLPHEYFNFNFNLLFMLLQLFQFPSASPTWPSPSPTSIVNLYTVVCVDGSFIYVPWLSPPPSYKQSPLPPSPLAAVSLFYDSMPLVLFYSLVYFVHCIPLISEIIWYFSFTGWLISLSITVSSYIHVVAKSRNTSFSSAV